MSAESKEKFTVMFYEVGKPPVVQEWPDGNLETMMICVNGFIKCIPHPISGLVIVMNEEGKLNQDPPNRHLYSRGKITDTIRGDFFICRGDGGEFISLTDKDIWLLTTECNSPEFIKEISGLVMCEKGGTTNG